MQVALYDRLTQKAVLAEITSMTEHNAQLASSTWVTSFQDRYRMHEHDEDSCMWATKDDHLDLFLQRSRMRSFALIAEEMVQGILFLQNETQPSRAENCRPLVYVRYVATAPWNRRNKSGAGRLRGVGTTLIAWARHVSREMGCDGRLGLHSLRSSDEFYHRLRFRNFGLDAAHRGMSYFELSDSSDTVAFEEIYLASQNLRFDGPANNLFLGTKFTGCPTRDSENSYH